MFQKRSSRNNPPRMKNKLAITALLGCGLLALNQTALAKNGSSDSGSHTNVAKYDARFVLTATPDAPKGSRGSAQVKSQRENDTTTSKLSLQTQGLNAGTYTVTAITSNGPVTLGEITLTEPSHGHGKLHSQSNVDLPPDLDAASITGLTVSEADTVLLEGDLTSNRTKSRSSFNATVPLIAGEAAPDVTGTARLKSTTKRGKTKNNFLLNAQGLPPSTTYTVEVNGTEAGQVTSNKQGHAVVKRLPAGTTNVGTVRLVDEGGLEAARAEF